VTVELHHACASAADARRLADSVRADNPRYVVVEADGPALRVRVRAPSAASARASVDDLLACLRAAERTAGG
jgi:hypothetical protein